MRRFGILAVAAALAVTACEDSTGPEQMTRGPDAYSPLMALGLDGNYWADFVVDSEQGIRYDGSCVLALRSDPNEALGEPDYGGGTGGGNWFSLGIDGSPDTCGSADPQMGELTVGFDVPIGGDLVLIAEATFERGTYPDETVEVYGRNIDTSVFDFLGNASGTSAISNIELDPDACYDQIRVVNSITAAEYEAGFGGAGNVPTEDALIPDGFDVDAIGASEICQRDEGCTFTQGFWKNHLDEWDETRLFPGTTFTWLTVFNTAPGKGADKRNSAGAGLGPDGLTSTELILAHQYMAAVLNVENGATPPTDVDLGDVEDHFDGTNPVDDATLLEWAGLLDDYNNGVTGPGHCDDDVNGEIDA